MTKIFLLLMIEMMLLSESYVPLTSWSHRRRRRRHEAGVEPSEGDVVLYRRDNLEIGVVTANMGCTQWIQPLVAHSKPEVEVTLFEDDSDQVMIQGGCEGIVESWPTQLPVPSLGGGIGYGSPAIDCFVVQSNDLPEDLALKVVEQGTAPWTH